MTTIDEKLARLEAIMSEMREKVEDMDTTLMASVLKVFGDVQNKVRKQVAQFYGVRGLMENEPTNTDSSTEEEQAPVALDGQEENVLQ